MTPEQSRVIRYAFCFGIVSLGAVGYSSMYSPSNEEIIKEVRTKYPVNNADSARKKQEFADFVNKMKADSAPRPKE
jgi:hypothetical protein